MIGGIDPPFGCSVLNSAVTAAGTAQADAKLLDALISIVTGVPPGSGVQVLRPALYVQTIVNAGTNPLNVWPRPGMTLSPSAANAAVVVQPGRTLGLVVQNDTQGYLLFNSSSFG